MPRYRVAVQRIEFHLQIVEVVASNQDEAEQAAIEAADGWNYETCETAKEEALQIEELRHQPAARSCTDTDGSEGQ